MRRGRREDGGHILPFMSGQKHLHIDIVMMHFKAALSFVLADTTFNFCKNIMALDSIDTRFDGFEIKRF